MNTKVNAKYFFFASLIGALILAVIIFWPFLTVLILGASVAVVFYPVHRWLCKKMPWQKGWLAALLTVSLFVVIVCAPLVLAGSVIINQANSLYHTITDGGGATEYLGRINETIGRILPESFSFTAEEKIADIAVVISNNVGNIFTATLNTILALLLMVLAVFYFLKDGAHFRKAAISLSPLPDEDDNKILTRLGDAVNGVVRGYLLIGLIQGVLTSIGLAIFGVPHAALFGLLANTSLIPSIGTALVTLPIILFLFATGDTNAGIGFAIWSGVLVGGVDNILNPILVGRRIRIPPLLVLFAVLGGISLLGPVGILIGPLTVSLLYALLSIYKEGNKGQTVQGA